MADDSFDDLWELAEFYACESMLLRSFLEYLRNSDAPVEKKMERVRNWRNEIANQFGNPEAIENMVELLQKARALPPMMRKAAFQKVVSDMRAKYFHPDFSS